MNEARKDQLQKIQNELDDILERLEEIRIAEVEDRENMLARVEGDNNGRVPDRFYDTDEYKESEEAADHLDSAMHRVEWARDHVYTIVTR